MLLRKTQHLESFCIAIFIPAVVLRSPIKCLYAVMCFFLFMATNGLTGALMLWPRWSPMNIVCEAAQLKVGFLFDTRVQKRCTLHITVMRNYADNGKRV